MNADAPTLQVEGVQVVRVVSEGLSGGRLPRVPVTDEQLMHRSIRDPAVFADLVPRHSTAVHAYLARRTNVDVADDLLQSVWLAAFSSRTTYRPHRGSVRAWLFGIARHVLVAHLGRSRTGAPTRTPVDPVADVWAAVDARLDAQARRSGLMAALRNLAQGDLELLLLVSWEQLSPTEAARVLGIPAGTARSRLHRARRQMRAQMQSRSRDEPAGQGPGVDTDHHRRAGRGGAS